MNIQNVSFIALLLAVSALFFAVIADFFMPIFWAATLAIIFRPLHLRIVDLMRGRQTVAALATLLFICITVLLPSWFVAAAFADEAAGFYQRVDSGEYNPERILDWTKSNLPIVLDLLERAGITFNEMRNWLSSAAVGASQFIASLAISAGQNAVRFAVMFVLMLYILYFLFRDGDALIEQFVRALPFGDVRERALMHKFAEVARATVKGNLVIGIIQGALGGIIFAILGVQGAVFWGCVMVILSLIPVVGAGLVWFPVAIGFFVQGEVWSGVILMLFGAFVIGLVDNVLRPLLVGRSTRMPDYLVLLSTLGGLSMFGASGFVIGPVIASLFLAMWSMFAEEQAGGDNPPASENAGNQ